MQTVGMTLLGTDVRRQTKRVGHALTVAQRQGNEAINLVFSHVHVGGLARALGSFKLRNIPRIASSSTSSPPAEPATQPSKTCCNTHADRGRATDERMNDAQLRDEVTTIFLAGHETTAIAFGWVAGSAIPPSPCPRVTSS